MKEQRRKPRWTKPKQGLLEKLVPRPKKPEGDESRSEEEEEPAEDNAINAD